jgi:anaerobic magnesium-protoporphyrin IX monomethyl ester cyclase
MLPPAIGILSALLKQHGHEVVLFDSTQYAEFPMKHRPAVNVDESKAERLMVKAFKPTEVMTEIVSDIYKDFASLVRSFDPQLVAMSCTEDLWRPGISLLKSIKKKKFLTIAGGVFPTFAPDLAISYPEVDMICKGEGENALVELCSRLESGQGYDDISNIWIKDAAGNVKENPLDMVDMNANPLIDVKLFEEARYYRPMAGQIYRMFPVEIFRGCPYSCRYCNSPWQSAMYRQEAGKNFLRRKSFEKIKEELIYYKEEMKAEYLYFWSDTFFSWTKKDFFKFAEIYEEISLPFWIQTRPETVKRDLFETLKAIGCHRISFGLEHGNEEFRARVLGRKITNKKIIRSLELVNEIGIPFSVNNMIGFPEETYDLAFDTIELNRHIQADDRNAYPFTPFHGIPLRDDCDRLGYTKYEDIVESLVATGSLLDMPQFPKKKVDGLCKTFNLYVAFPKERWPEIKIAEDDTTEGQQAYQKLKEEYLSARMQNTRAGQADDYGQLFGKMS